MKTEYPDKVSAAYEAQLQHHGRPHRLWHDYACFLLSRGSPDAALAALVQASRPVESPIMDCSVGVPPSEVAEAHVDYPKLLDGDARKDVYVWLNYCLLLSLLGKSPAKVFERALLAPLPSFQRKKCFLEYVANLTLALELTLSADT